VNKLDASTWIDFAGLVVNVATFALALFGISLWKSQLRGTSKHAVAIEIATEARMLSAIFFEARSPLYYGWEFKENAPPASKLPAEDYADAWAHVYENRWKMLQAQITVLARLASKGGAVLGDEVATNMEDLARTAGVLSHWMSEALAQKRAGPEVVKLWSDQERVRATSSYVTAGPDKDDKFSKEFLGALNSLLGLLKSHI
jgi:hypothetical protein